MAVNTRLFINRSKVVLLFVVLYAWSQWYACCKLWLFVFFRLFLTALCPPTLPHSRRKVPWYQHCTRSSERITAMYAHTHTHIHCDIQYQVQYNWLIFYNLYICLLSDAFLFYGVFCPVVGAGLSPVVWVLPVWWATAAAVHATVPARAPVEPPVRQRSQRSSHLRLHRGPAAGHL